MCCFRIRRILNKTETEQTQNGVLFPSIISKVRMTSHHYPKHQTLILHRRWPRKLHSKAWSLTVPSVLSFTCWIDFLAVFWPLGQAAESQWSCSILFLRYLTFAVLRICPMMSLHHCRFVSLLRCCTRLSSNHPSEVAEFPSEIAEFPMCVNAHVTRVTVLLWAISSHSVSSLSHYQSPSWRR